MALPGSMLTQLGELCAKARHHAVQPITSNDGEQRVSAPGIFLVLLLSLRHIILYVPTMDLLSFRCHLNTALPVAKAKGMAIRSTNFAKQVPRTVICKDNPHKTAGIHDPVGWVSGRNSRVFT